jgi:hypothetical protein
MITKTALVYSSGRRSLTSSSRGHRTTDHAPEGALESGGCRCESEARTCCSRRERSANLREGARLNSRQGTKPAGSGTNRRCSCSRASRSASCAGRNTARRATWHPPRRLPSRLVDNRCRHHRLLKSAVRERQRAAAFADRIKSDARSVRRRATPAPRRTDSDALGACNQSGATAPSAMPRGAQ